MKAEVAEIGSDGLSLALDKEAFRLDFKNYPWFKGAAPKQIKNLQVVHNQFLTWPELDIDLSINSLRHPEQYPLTYK